MKDVTEQPKPQNNYGLETFVSFHPTFLIIISQKTKKSIQIDKKTKGETKMAKRRTTRKAPTSARKTTKTAPRKANRTVARKKPTAKRPVKNGAKKRTNSKILVIEIK